MVEKSYIDRSTDILFTQLNSCLYNVIFKGNMILFNNSTKKPPSCQLQVVVG